ncbi:MAG: helix-turn-helix transcriptional regulator [Brachybacterium sp.]|nr:helix-turn-helix transcriptional regulator [Brachybacterium sp.]
MADVAAQAGVSMQHLSDVERGRKDASSEMLAAISGALGMSVAQLMAVAAQGVPRPALLDLTGATRTTEEPLAAPPRGGVMLSAA